jgi:hypothetical protein
MNEIASIAVVFLFFAGVIIILALVINPKLVAELRIFKFLLKIKTSRPSPGTNTQPTGSREPAKPARQTKAWLAIKLRGQPDWQYKLDGQSQIYLGRGSDNQIRLVHEPAADTRHAVIYFEQGRYYLNNLSPNGTWVNNHPASKHILGNGNKIRIGNTQIIFHERRN